MQLCGAKRISKGTYGSINRYLGLPELGGGSGAAPATLSHDSRLIVSQLNGELIVMRVPEGVRRKMERKGDCAK
jgi:hypothetical protein